MEFDRCCTCTPDLMYTDESSMMLSCLEFQTSLYCAKNWSQCYIITSVSKKLGQRTVVVHFCALFQFFWNRHYLKAFYKRDWAAHHISSRKTNSKFSLFLANQIASCLFVKRILSSKKFELVIICKFAQKSKGYLSFALIERNMDRSHIYLAVHMCASCVLPRKVDKMAWIFRWSWLWRKWSASWVLPLLLYWLEGSTQEAHIIAY